MVVVGGLCGMAARPAVTMSRDRNTHPRSSASSSRMLGALDVVAAAVAVTARTTSGKNMVCVKVEEATQKSVCILPLFAFVCRVSVFVRSPNPSTHTLSLLHARYPRARSLQSRTRARFPPGPSARGTRPRPRRARTAPPAWRVPCWRSRSLGSQSPTPWCLA